MEKTTKQQNVKMVKLPVSTFPPTFQQGNGGTRSRVMIGDIAAYTWFNIFAFAVCMNGPWQPWSDPVHVYAILTINQPGKDFGDIVAWADERGPRNLCINGKCLLSGPMPGLCNRYFDLDDDDDVDLRDLAVIMVGVVSCEAGRCLRVTP